MFRRTLTLGAMALAAGAAALLQALVQAKTPRVLVSFPAGGPVDSVARALAQQLGKGHGETVIVDKIKAE
jgi:tripartite-type tricarboxylate transporter receptor subunit TctC